MKTYLNSDERMQNVFILTVYGLIEVYLQNRGNYTEQEIKWLESAYMSLYEYSQALADRVGDKELFRICKMAKEYKPILKPRADKDESQYLIEKNAIEEICRMAVEKNCFGCEREDSQNCPLCQFMDKIGVGVVEEQEGKCTYWYPAEEGENDKN